MRGAGRGSLAQVAPSSADDQAMPVLAGRPAGGGGDDRVRERDDVDDRIDITGIGQIDKRPGEVRTGRCGCGRGGRAGRGDCGQWSSRG
jgi:hypothetical protein